MKKLIFITGTCIAILLFMATCSAGEAPVTALMMGKTTQAIVFLESKAIAEDEIHFSFSSAVTISYLEIEPKVKIKSINYLDNTEGDDPRFTVKVKLEEKLPPGVKILADLLAEDEENKNTINVLVQMKSRNNRMPRLVINEVRTEASKPRYEFIEFKLNSDGNLGGMRVIILGNTNATSKTVYEFASCEVKSGEYLTLNLRTTEEDQINEYGSDLSESGGTNSSPNSRDFWMPDSVKRIHKTSVIYVLDQDDNVLASLMMSETSDPWWKRSEHAEAAEFLFSKGAWKSPDGNICSPQDAVITATATATRTINRDETVENTNTALDWYITAASGNTPGMPNNEKRYNP